MGGSERKNLSNDKHFRGYYCPPVRPVEGLCCGCGERADSWVGWNLPLAPSDRPVQSRLCGVGREVLENVLRGSTGNENPCGYHFHCTLTGVGKRGVSPPEEEGEA